MQSNQFQRALVICLKSLTPDLGGLKRHLQHLPRDGGIVIERGDAFEVGFAGGDEVDDGGWVWHGGSVRDR